MPFGRDNSAPSDDAIVRQIAAALRSDGQYVVGVDGDDVEEIERARALGRKAGRQLGWKIRTYVSDPEKRDDHRSVVIIYVDESNPLHEELMRMRSDKKMRAAFRLVGPGRRQLTAW